MNKDDLAALLVDAPAEEVDQIHRLLHEWGVGPGDSFPVQLALLTKAQWRIAASLARAMNDSRKLIEQHLGEYRRQTGALVEHFIEKTGSASSVFEQTVTNHTEALKLAVSKSNGHLVETEKAALQVRFELDHATKSLKKELDQVRGELVDERVRMQEACRDWNASMSLREWFNLIFLSFAMLALGFDLALIWLHRH
jgi:hypothetical protein